MTVRVRILQALPPLSVKHCPRLSVNRWHSGRSLGKFGNCPQLWMDSVALIWMFVGAERYWSMTMALFFARPESASRCIASLARTAASGTEQARC